MHLINSKSLVKFSTLENGDLVTDVVMRNDGNFDIEIQSCDHNCGDVIFLLMTVCADHVFTVSRIA